MATEGTLQSDAPQQSRRTDGNSEGAADRTVPDVDHTAATAENSAKNSGTGARDGKSVEN